jgi:hypothetical protein
LPFLGGACCASLKLERESFHADDYKKEEENYGAQDGGQEGCAQNLEEEEDRKEEAESETEIVG